MKLSDIAERLGVTLEGDGDREIAGVEGIERAGPDQLTFVANPKYASLVATTRAGAILLEPGFPPVPHTATLRTPNPYHAFAEAIRLFYRAPAYTAGVHSTAVIHPSAVLGPGTHVGPYAVIEADVVIGENSVILSHCVIYQGAVIGHRFFAHAHAMVREFCTIGDDVTLQNGAIVGADGFGFSKQEGQWSKIVQSGVAVLGDRVEVQSNACVDRASIGETRIGDGTKIDNLVQVGHGSSIGSDTLLCAQAGLAGSTEVGNRVILAGQVGVAGHCRVGNDVVATAQTGIPGDVADGSMVSGYPAMDNRQWLRAVAAFSRLPEMLRDLRSLKKAAESGK